MFSYFSVSCLGQTSTSFIFMFVSRGKYIFKVLSCRPNDRKPVGNSYPCFRTQVTCMSNEHSAEPLGSRFYKKIETGLQLSSSRNSMHPFIRRVDNLFHIDSNQQKKYFLEFSSFSEPNPMKTTRDLISILASPNILLWKLNQSSSTQHQRNGNKRCNQSNTVVIIAVTVTVIVRVSPLGYLYYGG